MPNPSSQPIAIAGGCQAQYSSTSVLGIAGEAYLGPRSRRNDSIASNRKDRETAYFNLRTFKH
eukprot:281105-Alexandrium_andersonii.AAC.1